MNTRFEHIWSIIWVLCGLYLIALPTYSKLILFFIALLCLFQAAGLMFALWSEQVDRKIEEEEEQFWKLYNDKDND
jgi:uncharacterized membrane protein